MADGDGNIIPFIEDDQGEGIKNFIEDFRDHMSEATSIPERFLKEKKPETATEAIMKMMDTIERMEKRINRIMVRLNCDDKSEILKL